MLAAIGVLLAAYGLLKAMLGYKMFKFSLFCSGFGVGAVTGVLIGGYMLLSGDANGAVVVMAGLLFGIIFGVLCLLLWRVGVFIMCFVYGCLFVLIPSVIFEGMSLFTELSKGKFDFNSDFNLEGVIFFALVVGLVLGVVGVILARPVVIVVTGITGGMFTGAGLCMMTEQYSFVMFFIIGILAAGIGILIQFMTTRGSKTKNPSYGYGNQPVVRNQQLAGNQQVVGNQQTARQQAPMQQTSSQQPGADLRENISQNAASAQKYASQTLEGLKENGGKAAAAIRRTGKEGMETLRSRQKTAMEQALARKKDMTETDLLIQTESALYQSRVTAWILPFVEPLTGVAAVLFILLGVCWIKGVYGIFYGLEMGMPVFLAACLLSAVKRNRLMASGILGGAALVEVILGVWQPAAFWVRIWLIALYMGLLVWYNRSFLGKKADMLFGSSVKRMAAGKGAGQQSSGSFCEKCGAELSGNVKFCPKCGNVL